MRSAPRPCCLHPWHYFRDLLLETGHLVPIRDYELDYLSISAPDVLAHSGGGSGWEPLVPAAAADAIKAGGLSGIAGEFESVDSAPRRLYPGSRA